MNIIRNSESGSPLLKLFWIKMVTSQNKVKIITMLPFLKQSSSLSLYFALLYFSNFCFIGLSYSDYLFSSSFFCIVNYFAPTLSVLVYLAMLSILMFYRIQIIYICCYYKWRIWVSIHFDYWIQNAFSKFGYETLDHTISSLLHYSNFK